MKRSDRWPESQIIQGLNVQIHDVAAAAEEISAGVQQVAGAAEEQTATVEEISASAESLERISENLLQAIERFKLGERDGAKALPAKEQEAKEEKPALALAPAPAGITRIARGATAVGSILSRLFLKIKRQQKEA